MLNLGKFVKESPVTKAIKSLPSPIGWWEISSHEGCEGERTENHGVFYGHIAEILFPVPKNAGWRYCAKYKRNMPAPAERPFYTPVRDSANLSYSSYNWSEDSDGNIWGNMANITFFAQWMNCSDRVRVSKCNYYQTHTLELIK